MVTVQCALGCNILDSRQVRCLREVVSPEDFYTARPNYYPASRNPSQPISFLDGRSGHLTFAFRRKECRSRPEYDRVSSMGARVFHIGRISVSLRKDPKQDLLSLWFRKLKHESRLDADLGTSSKGDGLVNCKSRFLGVRRHKLATATGIRV